MKSEAAAKKAKKLTAAEKAVLEKTAKQFTNQAVRESHNFRGFSSSQVHSTVINGKSLWQRVFDAKYSSLCGK